MTLGIVGAGAWGTALACVASDNTDVVLFTRDNARQQEIESTRENAVYLPGVHISETVQIVSHLSDLGDVDNIIVAVPSFAFRDTVQSLSFIDATVGFVSVTKGLEQATTMRMSQVMHDADPQRDDETIGVLSGPNLAQEIGNGFPAATVVASSNEALAESIQSALHTEKFRVYTSDDVVGCEIAGVAKNVIAIAVGIGDGLGYGDNSRAAVMTRALAEISRLVVAEGGHPATMSGLAGVGDLIATCTSSLSRNRNVGLLLGQGKDLDEISEITHDIAEGVFSARALSERAEVLGIDMPIVRAVAETIENKKLLPDALKQLMSRPAGKE